MTDTALRLLAKRLAAVEKRVRSVGSTSQLAHSSIEDGALQAYNRAGEQTMVIGKQWDGTYAPIVVTGPIPPTPSGLTVTDATNGVVIGWDGSFAGGLIPVPMDFLRVDAHVGAVPEFVPDHTNRLASFVAPQGGSVSATLPPGSYYIKLVCWTIAGKVSLASDPVSGDSLAVEVSTDGEPPASSPAAEVVGGYQALSIRWTPITNPDPVRYKIYVGTAPGFTKDATTQVGVATGSQFTLRLLPGAAPADPNDPDPRELQYDTTYYVAIIAEDDDGEAPVGAEGSAMIFKIEGGAIGAQTIVGDNILGNTITADKFSSTLVLASEIWTALSGQRVGLTPAGFQGYKADGSLMLNFPTDPSQTALLDADLIARSMTLVGNMTMRSNSNSIEKDAILKLRNGISAPVAAPQLGITYFTYDFSTSSLTDAQKTGELGTFDFKGSEVSCLEWKDASSYWVVHQIRPTGTRAWFFDYEGTPRLTGGEYFHDYHDWEIWSVVEITTSSTPAKNGVYRMARWIPSGSAQTYYLWSPFGLNRYSRQNNQPPVIGTNGEDVYVAEVISNQLNIRYFATLTGDQSNAVPTTIYQSSTGFTSTHPLSNVTYDAAGFDIGSPRYLVSERGFATDNKLVYTSGTNANSIFLGGSGNSWVSSTVNAETFETAYASPRATAWDGFNFWTMGGDGKMYQYTETYWDPSVDSSTIWMEHTFKDNNAAGTGQHETTPGPARSITWKRRSKISVFMPPIPGAGGVDEPNAATVYAGRGLSQPSNSGFHLQYEGNTGVAYFDGFDFTDPIPPTTNSFPNTNPGKIQSDDGNMVISGDGTIKIGGKDVALGTPTVQYMTSSGTWTKPAGLKAAYVELVGAGGGSGGLSNGGTNQGETGPGGGGSWSGKWYLAGDLSATESVTVGVGGNAGTTAGTNGTAGGSTVFKGQTAGPGGGGTGYSVNPRLAALVTPGGSGGVATGGDVNLPGQPGSCGRTITGLVLLQTRGGSPPMGYGFGGVINNVSGTGVTGTGYGAGGGACWHGASTAAAGAPGTGGLFKITMYF
jgi:hypothetical protein